MNDDMQPYLPEDDGRLQHELLYQSLSPKQKQFIGLLRQSFGNILTACRNMKPEPIHRQTYYYWKHNNPNFAAVLASEQFEEELLDYAESRLIEKVKEKDTIALIFLLKTRGKKRGYNEKEEPKKTAAELDQKPSWFADTKELPQNLDAFEEPEFEMVPNKKDANEK